MSTGGDYTCGYCDEGHESGCVNLACPVGYHNCASMALNDEVADAVDPLKELLAAQFALGKTVALDEYAKVLRERSATEFVNGKDDLAMFLRKLAKETHDIASAARELYNRKFKDIP